MEVKYSFLDLNNKVIIQIRHKKPIKLLNNHCVKVRSLVFMAHLNSLEENLFFQIEMKSVVSVLSRYREYTF